MFAVILKEESFTGSRISYSLVKDAATPEKALAYAKSQMHDRGVRALEKGKVQVTILEYTTGYKLVGGKLESEPN